MIQRFNKTSLNDSGWEWWAASKLDGVSDHFKQDAANFGQVFQNDASIDRTYAVWVRLDTVTSAPNIIISFFSLMDPRKRTDTLLHRGMDIGIEIKSTGTIFNFISDFQESGGALDPQRRDITDLLTGGPSISSGEWVHFACVYDADGVDSTHPSVTHYINGRSDQYTQTVSIETLLNTDDISSDDDRTGFVFGARTLNETESPVLMIQFFNGVLGEFMIFKEALNADAVWAIYNERRQVIPSQIFSRHKIEGHVVFGAKGGIGSTDALKISVNSPIFDIPPPTVALIPSDTSLYNNHKRLPGGFR